MLVIPNPRKTMMLHTAITSTMGREVNAIAKRMGLKKNIVINTLLAEGLKRRGDFMAKAKKTSKKVTKKATKTKKY